VHAVEEESGTRWRLVVRFKPRPLYRRGKIIWYPANRKLGGFRSRFGLFEKKHFSL
jgi:hypothetical protein